MPIRYPDLRSKRKEGKTKSHLSKRIKYDIVDNPTRKNCSYFNDSLFSFHTSFGYRESNKVHL